MGSRLWSTGRMDVAELLIELHGRVTPLAHDAVEGLEPDDLRRRPDGVGNPIGWLVWHLARVQDHHVSELIPTDQIWTTGGHAAAFGLEPDPGNTGYGHDEDDVAAVAPVSTDALLAYVDAVAERTRSFVEGVVAGDLDRVVDDSWDPPVTLGVRLVSVADDCLQHVGQAAYARGLLDADRTG